MDSRFVEWLEAAKRRAADMEQLTPYAPRSYTLRPLAASAPEWFESRRVPVQDAPNLITLLPRQRREISLWRSFHGKGKAA